MQTYDSSLAPRFKQILAEREAELRSLLRGKGDLPEEGMDTEPREVIDFKDVATEQIQATVDGTKADYAAHELENVVAARRRLDDRSYGYCLDCGEAIDLRRLTALPAARFCTACQAIYERGQSPAMWR